MESLSLKIAVAVEGATMLLWRVPRGTKLSYAVLGSGIAITSRRKNLKALCSGSV